MIPLIDIFAGPGGLGEGFSSLRDRNGHHQFKIKLSVEMDAFAHRTLLLRSLFREFGDSVPNQYYEYLRGEEPWKRLTAHDFVKQFREGKSAVDEAWREELRPSIADAVDDRIRRALGPSRLREQWVLVGGPPCQAYSLVGRVRMLAERGDRFYSDHRHHLYKEYLRLLAEHEPTVFIMENVKGLLSSRSKTGALVFQRILSDLQRPPRSSARYRLFSISPRHEGETPLLEEVTDPRRFVVEAEDHGIPQARHRVIILGVNERELSLSSAAKLIASKNKKTCGDAIGDLPPLRSGVTDDVDSAEAWIGIFRSVEKEKWYKHVARTDRGVAARVKDAVRQLAEPKAKRGGQFIECQTAPNYKARWFRDARLRGVCNHETRGHRSDDLHRYLFAASYAREHNASPRLQDFPSELLPRHANVRAAIAHGLFNDRFRVQLEDFPATTITSHLSKDGHYFIHPDPAQCRSLTVREAARIQTFPDNYFFEGPRTEQYKQVGNAVPPLLASEIAKVVADLLR